MKKGEFYYLLQYKIKMLKMRVFYNDLMSNHFTFVLIPKLY